MTNNKLYARDEYLKKKAADSNGLNIQLTNNYAFRKHVTVCGFYYIL